MHKHILECISSPCIAHLDRVLFLLHLLILAHRAETAVVTFGGLGRDSATSNMTTEVLRTQLDAMQVELNRLKAENRRTRPRGPTLQIQRTRFQNFLRFQDFTRDFKISLEISRFHSRSQDFIEITRFHSRFQDFTEISRFHRDFKISLEISRFLSRFQDFIRDFRISLEISRFL